LTEAPQPTHDEPAPIFGSWARLYAAVLAWTVLLIGLVGLFSHAAY